MNDKREGHDIIPEVKRKERIGGIKVNGKREERSRKNKRKNFSNVFLDKNVSNRGSFQTSKEQKSANKTLPSSEYF